MNVLADMGQVCPTTRRPTRGSRRLKVGGGAVRPLLCPEQRDHDRPQCVSQVTPAAWIIEGHLQGWSVIRNAAAVVGLGLLVAACSSSASPGGSTTTSIDLVSQSSAQIIRVAAAAVEEAKSVSLYGTITEDGTTGSVRLLLSSNGDISGSLPDGGQEVRVILLGSTDYFRADAHFWQVVGHLSAAVASRIGSQWVEAPASSAPALDALTLPALAQRIAAAPGNLSGLGVKTIDGVPSVGVGSPAGGKIWVSTVGEPYPVRVVGTVTAAGGDAAFVLNFRDWNVGEQPAAPRGALSS
jgi:hypothetical protein